jgi:hypothetical protein
MSVSDVVRDHFIRNRSRPIITCVNYNVHLIKVGTEYIYQDGSDPTRYSERFDDLK